MAAIDTSVEFNGLMLEALNTGFGIVAKTGGPLQPFVFVQDQAGKRHSKYFGSPVGKYEESLELARTFVAENKATFVIYALVYYGFLTLNGQRWEAIFVEAGARDRKKGLLLGQPYNLKGFFKKRYAKLGKPLRIEEPPSRIFQG